MESREVTDFGASGSAVADSAAQSHEDFDLELGAPLTALLGRDGELAEGVGLLRDPAVRLVTIIGSPGVGKTRLAIALGQRCASEFVDGASFVDLASVADARLVPATIASALGLREGAGSSPLERLRRWLRSKELLLVLDNFEHVVAAGPVIAELLAAAAGVKALVTSRALLRISPEHELSLAPLVLPSPDASQDPRELARVPAVALFCERARAVDSDFQLNADSARAIAEICVALDGLPLAIELAAARANVLPPEAMRNRLSSRLDFLGTGPLDAPLRQRTLRATLEWSYELLNDSQKRLFARLGVFSGGFTLDAVARVGEIAEEQALDRIGDLVDRSLVRRIDEPDAEPRLTMLETLREYAQERLAAGYDAIEAQLAHARFYLDLALEAEPALVSETQGAWLDRLEREHDNLRSALRFLLDQGNDHEALAMVAALWRFWAAHGHLDEGRQFCERALAEEGGDASLRGKAICGLAFVAHDEACLGEAKRLFAEAIELTREAEPTTAALALGGLAFVAAKEGDFAAAREMYEEALHLANRAGRGWLTAHLLERLGTALWMEGEFAPAEERFHRSAAGFRDLGDRGEAAFAVASLGMVKIAQGDLAGGSALIDESLPVLRASGNPRPLAQALLYAGEARIARGESGPARAAYAEVIAELGARGFLYGIWLALSGAARVAAGDRRLDEAGRLFGAAAALAERIGGVAPAFIQGQQEDVLERTRSTLGEEAFGASFEAGTRLQLADAMREATATPRSWAAGEELTAREVEVVRLVAEGLSNREIAEHLFLSIRTVHAHLRSIYRKLDVSSRMAASRRAAELGLLEEAGGTAASQPAE